MDMQYGSILCLHLDTPCADEMGTVAEHNVYTAKAVERLALDFAMYDVIGCLAELAQSLPFVVLSLKGVFPDVYPFSPAMVRINDEITKRILYFLKLEG